MDRMFGRKEKTHRGGGQEVAVDPHPMKQGPLRLPTLPGEAGELESPPPAPEIPLQASAKCGESRPALSIRTWENSRQQPMRLGLESRASLPKAVQGSRVRLSGRCLHSPYVPHGTVSAADGAQFSNGVSPRPGHVLSLGGTGTTRRQQQIFFNVLTTLKKHN